MLFIGATEKVIQICDLIHFHLDSVEQIEFKARAMELNGLFSVKRDTVMAFKVLFW